MSYLRAKSRAINRNVYYDNRLTTFTNLPIRSGNLFVEKNETIAEDLQIGGDVQIGGDLEIGGDLSAKNFYSNKGNFLFR